MAEKRRYARRMTERVVALERAVHRLKIRLSDKRLRKCVKKSGAAKTERAESGTN
jgi:DNA-binding FrmR family transcriptional regulator